MRSSTIILALEADDIFDGQIELDESHFGRPRKGKRGRRAAGKVFTESLDTKTTTLILFKPDSWVYTDTYL